MSDLIVSLFDYSKDAIPKAVPISWDDFARTLGPHKFDKPNKDSLPAFSPAEYRGGSVRLAKNVLRVHFGVLDLDKISAEQLLTVLRQLEPYNAVVYTTWSHPKFVSQGLWCVRVCVQLNRPVEIQEWKTFWSALTSHFGNLNDPQCKDPNRIYYAPYAPIGTEHECLYYINRGRPLIVEDLSASRLSVETAATGSDKIGRDRLERLALRWKRSRDEWRSTMGETLHRLTKGEPFAEDGHVDTTIFQLCNDLAAAFPTADPASIAAHFGQSLQLMNYKGLYPIEKVEDKLRRALANQAAEIAAEAEAEITEKKLRIRQAFAHVDPTRDFPYTEKELEDMAEKIKASREEMTKRWIIQRGNLFYLLGPGARYSEAYTERDVSNAVIRDLAPAQSSGVDLWTRSHSGDLIRKSLPALMGEFGTVATNYILDMRAQEASYEPATKLFIEAPCPIRPLVPTFDRDVAQWLDLMCGPAIRDVLNWIALVTSLDETCAALMFTGAKGVGKSLLAEGLARIWTTSGATRLSSAMGDFNDAIAKCPLIFGDEQLPKDFKGHGRTAELREFIAARSRPFKKKFYPETSILGAIRLIIAANNEDILAIQENLSVNDIEAISDRFFHVQVYPGAADYVETCRPASFINEDRIARHALWLRDNHPVTREGRFLIKSKDRGFHRALTVKAGTRSSVCQWLIGYLREPRRLDLKGDYAIRIKHRRLCVTTKGILDNWDLYVQNENVPRTGVLHQALQGLTFSERAHLALPKGGSAHYRVVDTETLYAWATENEFATRQEIDSALLIDTENRTEKRA